MKLIDLPPELLVVILNFLPAKDACRWRLSCRTLKYIFDQDPFYRKIVQKYAPMTGLWQSLDRIRKFYGRLLKVSFCEITKQITFETLIPDPDIRNDIQNSKVVSISLNNSNKVKIVDKFGKPAEIIFHKAIADENDNVGDIRLEKPSMDNEDKTSDTDDDILHLDEDVLEIIYSSGTQTRYTRVLTRDWVTKYHRGHISGSPQLASVAPGLFKAVYGGHGVELVHFQDGQGVKVTGDPDVPFNEMTFRVTCGLRISLPIEIQSDSMVLKEVTEKHFTRYTIPNVDSVNSVDFVIPESMHRRDEVPKSITKCLGRWVGEAQLASDGFFPYCTPANLLLFNDDTFAVMLLDPYLIRMYYRVNV